MRLFVGVRCGSATTDALQEALRPVWAGGHDVAWTRPSGWHVTLAYLGEVAATPEDVADVIRPVAEAADVPVLGLAWPARWFDRAAVVPVEGGAPWCVTVGQQVQERLGAGGLPVVARRVEPHVTVCRRRGARGDARAASLTDTVFERLAVDDLPPWSPATLDVFASVTGDGPASYPVVASAVLGAA